MFSCGKVTLCALVRKITILVNETFFFQPVSEYLISKILLKLKSKALGSDNLNITLITLCCPFIIPFITHIINCCLSESHFPQSWKSANVIPLPKIKNPTEFGNLRSISILPTLSKILEKVMELQINTFLNNNNIIPSKQSGFRAGYSCSTALSDLTDDIVRAQDNSNASVLILLDYTKAFDMLHHEILLSILKYVGFSKSASLLVSSFLSKRSQRVTLDGQYSESLNIFAGVPQGSILGPLLYSIFTSNFIKSLKFCQYHLYADDTQIYLSFKPSEVAAANKLINEDLKSWLDESNKHLLKINPNKSVALLFCNENIRNDLLGNIELNLGQDMISFKNSAKNLGLVMDSKLKFKEHITLCLKRAYSVLRGLYSHRHYLCQRTKTLLCDSLILSHFNFCDHLYGPFLDSIDVRRVQKVQNSCIRFACGIRRRDRVSHKLNELGWLSMFNRRSLHSLCFFFINY
nr:reverse transcriptase family protein [Rickettsia endosymbiont of Ceutorhynchus assimilis]